MFSATKNLYKLLVVYRNRRERKEKKLYFVPLIYTTPTLQ